MLIQDPDLRYTVEYFNSARFELRDFGHQNALCCCYQRESGDKPLLPMAVRYFGLGTGDRLHRIGARCKVI